MTDSEQRREFLEEIQLMKAVGSHKNIVNMVGCCTIEEPMFLLTEYVPYGDLLHYLRKHRGKVRYILMLLRPTEDSLWNSDVLFGLYQRLMTLPFPLTNDTVLPETFYDVRRMVTLCRVTGYFNLVSEALSLLTMCIKAKRRNESMGILFILNHEHT